jgi:hypothetical protein
VIARGPFRQPPAPRPELGNLEPVDPYLGETGLAVELRPLGYVPQPRFQRAERVLLGVVLAKVLVDKLDNSRHLAAAKRANVTMTQRPAPKAHG